MVLESKLNLDEALVSINKSSIVHPLEVYYQIEECFGCPLEKLKISGDKLDSFIIGTKYSLQLELRKQTSDGGANVAKCLFSGLQLNSHGQYQIDVAEHNSNGNLSCSLKVLDKGECLLCPFAILTCLLLAIIAIEKLNARFWRSSKSSYRQEQEKLSRELASHNQQVASFEGDVDQSGGVSPETSESTSPPSTHEVDIGQPRQQFNQQSQEQHLTNSGGGRNWLNNGMATNAQSRVEALDAFRGLTIAGMIFVNYGGAGYLMLEHKPWDGITLADFVFPFFIFAMGASIAISTRSLVRKQKRSFHEMARKIACRCLTLATIGLCLNSKWLDYENSNFNKLRITGVLQRFSISYLIVASMYTIELIISKWIKAQSITNVPIISKSVGATFELLTAVNYTAIYVFVTFFLNYDSVCPIGYTGPGGMTDGGQYANCTGGAAAWLDRVVLGDSHLYHGNDVKQIFKSQVSHDPEGILGYSTSILLTLIGLQCGKLLVKRHQQQVHKKRLVALGKWVALLAISCSLIVIIPINKRLWSLTFVLVTGLAAFLTVLLLYLLLDVHLSKRTFLMRLLISSGKNSIFLYIGHSLLANMLPWWFPVDQTSHLQLLIRLTWATFVWLLVAHYLALKQIFIKI